MSSRVPADPDEDSKDTLDVELADVDANGLGFQNRLLVNDGLGNFKDETNQRMPKAENNSTKIDLADIGSDGDLDAVVASPGATELLINYGSGNFSATVLSAVTPPGPSGIAVPFPPFFTKISAEAIFTDIDNDGDPDILIANENPIPGGQPGDLNEAFINDGSGNFSAEPSRLPSAIDNTSGIAAGDIDADGDTDLIIGNLGQNLIYVNDGTDHFCDETASRVPAIIDSTRKVVLADLDGDGDLDLVTGNSRNQQNRCDNNKSADLYGHYDRHRHYRPER